MKTFILTSVFIIGYMLTVFGQAQSNTLPDNRLMRFKSGPPTISFFKDTLNKEKLNVPFSTRNLKNAKDKTFKIGQREDQKLMVKGGMPIIKPEGSFPMPVYKPDSTIHFTMRIKEYKGNPPIDFK